MGRGHLINDLAIARHIQQIGRQCGQPAGQILRPRGRFAGTQVQAFGQSDQPQSLQRLALVGFAGEFRHPETLRVGGQQRGLGQFWRSSRICAGQQKAKVFRLILQRLGEQFAQLLEQREAVVGRNAQPHDADSRGATIAHSALHNGIGTGSPGCRLQAQAVRQLAPVRGLRPFGQDHQQVVESIDGGA